MTEKKSIKIDIRRQTCHQQKIFVALNSFATNQYRQRIPIAMVLSSQR